MFITHYDGNFKIDNTEIQEGKYWGKEEIKQNIGKEIFTQNFEIEFEMLLKAGLS